MAKISTYEDDASVLGTDKVIGTDAVDGSTKNYTMDGIAAYAALQASVGDMSKATYDPSNIEEQLIGVSAAQSLTNKSVNGVVLNDAGSSSQYLAADGTYNTPAVGGDMSTATYDPASIDEQLVGLVATQSLTNKTVNGVVLNDAGAATNFLAEDGNYITLDEQPANAVLISAKVNEAGGITAGQVVYITGATGGFPQVSLADNTDFSKGNVLAIAIEDKSDNQTILVCISGLIEGIDTSAFTEGDIVYLGTSGNLTATHPSGINVVQRLGFATKINASTGSIIMDIDNLTVINNHDGIMRFQLVNQNTGTSASSAYTIVNDADHRSSLSMVGSNYTVVAGIAESLVIYNEGYNKTINANDGDFGFEWWTDETDSHDLSSTSKMALLSNGNLGLGTTTPAQTFHVVGEACVEHTATQPDEHGLEIMLDAAGFGDVKAIDVVYTTGAIGAGEDEGVILINIDESLATGGEVFALEVLTTTLGTDSVIGMKTGVGVAPISQDSGVFANIATILNKAVDVTTALSSGGAGNISIFVEDNDTITIGAASKFAELEVLIGTGASRNVQPTWEYSTGVGVWSSFTPTDGTNGFQDTGAMLWDSDDLAGWAVGTGSEYLVRITRTRNGLPTTPIVDLIQFAAPDIFSWDENGDVAINTLIAAGTPAFDDDTAAGAGDVVTGGVYQTTGNAASPLDVAGILMIKQ